MKQTRSTLTVILLSITSALIAALGLNSCNALVIPERSFQSRLRRRHLQPQAQARVREKSSSNNFIDSAANQRMMYNNSFLASHRHGNSEEIPTIKMDYHCSRRTSFFAMIGLGAGTATLALPISTKAAIAAAAEGGDKNSSASNSSIEDEAAKKAAAKERMAQRIAESKLNYRKPTDLVIERKENTDYSCVSTTGSPCPEGLVPAAVQREIVGALQKRME